MSLDRKCFKNYIRRLLKEDIEIKGVKFYIKDEINVPQEVVDISLDQDSSVLIWNETNNCLNVWGNDKIIFSSAASDSDCSLFEKMTTLEYVDFNDAVDSTNWVSTESMFCGCTSLSVVDFKGITFRNTANFTGMFCQCESLLDLVFENFDASTAVTTLNMFTNCYNLRSITGLNFESAPLNCVAGMFSHCSNLEKIIDFKFNTKNIDNFSALFSHCKNLSFENINLSDWDVSNGTLFSEMFYLCYQLKTLDLSSWDVSKAIDFHGMFRTCKNLKELILPSIEATEVTSVSYMFFKCESLKYLDVAFLKHNKCDGFEYMFNNCSNLKYIYNIEQMSLEYATSMRCMFKKCKNLKSIILNRITTDRLTSIKEIACRCEKLTVFQFDNICLTKLTDAESAFAYCFALKCLSLGDGESKTNTFYSQDMFYSCCSLTAVYLKGFKFCYNACDRNLYFYMFKHCARLKIIYLSDDDINYFEHSNDLIVRYENY